MKQTDSSRSAVRAKFDNRCLVMIFILFGARFQETSSRRVENFYKLHYANEIEPEDLMSELSKPLKPKDVGRQFPVSVGRQVADILARAKYKSRENMILGKFSVNDLLDLNTMEMVDDCHRSRRNWRENLCNSLKDEEGKDHANLLAYCQKMNLNLVDWCNFLRYAVIEFELKRQKLLKRGIELSDKLLRCLNTQGEIGSLNGEGLTCHDLIMKNDGNKKLVEAVCPPLVHSIRANYSMSKVPTIGKDPMWCLFKFCEFAVEKND